MAGDFPQAVGQPLPRVDGPAKVTGVARYVDDLTVDGMLHGRTVRSDVSHAVLNSIDLDPAFDWDGLTVVTAADIPAENVVVLFQRDQPVLVPPGGTIRHPDEPVALIAGEDPVRVGRALEHITLKTSPLPGVFDIESSERCDVLLHGKDNVLEHLTLSKGDVDAALENADLVIEGVYRTGAQEQMYIEPQGMIASWQDGAVTVQGSIQCPYFVHSALKPIFGLSDEQVIVAQAVTGGGFGGKEEYPSLLAAHAALLARASGVPVKMIYDRSEDIGATPKRHPCRVIHRLGLNLDGTLVGADVRVDIDGGAYVTLSPVVLSRAVLHAAGPYRIPHVRVVGRAWATNTPPHGAFRGFGAPQVTFAYERQLEKAARTLGVDPFELRRKNALTLGDETATGQRLDYSVGAQACLDAVAGIAGPPPPRDGRPTPEAMFRRGRGFAFYLHGAGFTGSGEERIRGKVSVAARADGHFEVRAASTDIGQGAFTVFTQMAATSLDVPLQTVHVARPQTDMVPNSGPTVASRTCMVVGAVVEGAANMVAQRLREHARQASLDASDLGAVARHFVAEHGELVETATYELPPGVHFDDATYTGDAYPVYGWACCMVDLTLDLDTYEVTVDRLIHAIDVGKAINPIIVKGQIEGGTLQALGWALWEHVLYQNGRVLNRRMTDNIIPTAMEAPEMETIIVEEPFPFGPHGAKGVGEIPMDGPGAAVANALHDALSDELSEALPDQLPLLPEVIAQLLAGETPTPWIRPGGER